VAVEAEASTTAVWAVCGERDEITSDGAVEVDARTRDFTMIKIDRPVLLSDVTVSDPCVAGRRDRTR
jgi:hypothetical protein